MARTLFLFGFLSFFSLSAYANMEALHITTPQYISVMLNPNTDHDRLVPERTQYSYSQHYLKKFYQPWSVSQSRFEVTYAKQKINVTRMEVNQINYVVAHPGYTLHGSRHSSHWTHAVKANMHLNDFPNMDQNGILVHNSYLRSLPTMEVRLKNSLPVIHRQPFDTLQISSLWAGTPVKVIQISRDKKWVFVLAPRMLGWVPFKDVAYVTDDFVEHWRTGHTVSTVHNKTPIVSKAHKPLFEAYLGSIYPYSASTKQGYVMLVPLMNSHHWGVIGHVWVSNTHFNHFPVSATPAHFALLIQQLMGMPYGWGGWAHNADCSGTMLRIFSPMGIWLPRSSPGQASVGFYKSLNHQTQDQRLHYIARHGKPFLSLIYISGHIMLYVGNLHGQPIIFHNIWGLSTYHHGRIGFAYAGKAILSRVNVGSGYPNYGHTILARNTFGVGFITE